MDQQLSGFSWSFGVGVGCKLVSKIISTFKQGSVDCLLALNRILPCNNLLSTFEFALSGKSAATFCCGHHPDILTDLFCQFDLQHYVSRSESCRTHFWLEFNWSHCRGHI